MTQLTMYGDEGGAQKIFRENRARATSNRALPEDRRRSSATTETRLKGPAKERIYILRKRMPEKKSPKRCNPRLRPTNVCCYFSTGARQPRIWTSFIFRKSPNTQPIVVAHIDIGEYKTRMLDTAKKYECR